MKKALQIFLILIITLSFSSLGSAQSLNIAITTSKPVYDLGEAIVITGNLTLGGSPVSDGLVTIQVSNPRDQTIILRTLTTGIDPPKPWIIEILEFFPCDASGNIQTSFSRGGNAGFKVSLKNNALSDYAVIVPIYIQYSGGVPFTLFTIYEGIVEAGRTLNATTWPVPIPKDAPTGTTYAYANALTGYPKDNGYAYSPEKATTFLITASTSSTSTSTANEPIYTASDGTFNMAFKVSDRGGMLGNYTVHASSRYSYYLVTGQTIFKTILVGDITGLGGVPDGKVDVRDVSRVAKAYGSKPGQPNWDPICDLNGDGKIDVKDVSAVARNYGKYGTLP